MKMTLTFKDPDVLSEAIEQQIRFLKKDLMKTLGISEAAAEVEAEERMKKMNRLFNRHLEYGEYIHIEFDDEAETATVMEL